MNGHEHAVSIFARSKLDQRLIREAGHGLDDLAEIVRLVRADGIGTLKGEATREDSEPPKHTLLGRVEEPVTPLDGRPQARMAVIDAALGGERAQGSGHDPGESRDAHVSRASGGELDRKRQPVGRATDRDDIGARRPIENEAWLSESGSFDEEPHSVRCKCLPDPGFTRRRRNGEWRDPPNDLAVDPERRPARRQNAYAGGRVEKSSRAGCRGVDHVLAVVEGDHHVVTAHREHRGDRGLAEAAVAGETESKLDGWGDRDRIAKRCKIDPYDGQALESRDHLIRDPRLAATARAGQRQQPRSGAEPTQRGQFAFSSDEARLRDRCPHVHWAEG